ncbi:hypothetical protein L3X38_034432 [Prunus dulcis]|uniref:Uncharacterized protein n=1 Tax=Prunus dulcis TaxID=3755 RepID=A0AAD4YYK0_PRUDU|nr:hypothetical protein L3X38_034432 [Prunus dulcis]
MYPSLILVSQIFVSRLPNLEFKIKGSRLLLCNSVFATPPLLHSTSTHLLRILTQVADNFYRPDLKKAALARAGCQDPWELLHYELVYNYSGSKHITESLKRCGISESSTYVLATYFNSSSDEIEQKAVEKLSTKSSRETINGKEIDLEELGGRLDQAQIQKHYKITSVELGISSVADAIT